MGNEIINIDIVIEALKFLAFWTVFGFLLVWLVWFLFALLWGGQKQKRRQQPAYRRRDDYWETEEKNQTEQSIDVNLEFLEAIENNTISGQTLLNYAERQIYWHLVRLLGKRGYIITTQVSLGEILQSPDELAFRGFNSKRVDFLILNKDFDPVAAIEYNGKGHYGETKASRASAELRDYIKQTALEKADIGYIAITKFDEATVRKALKEHGWEG